MDVITANEIDIVMPKKPKELILAENRHVSLFPRPASPGSPIVCQCELASASKGLQMNGASIIRYVLPVAYQGSIC